MPLTTVNKKIDEVQKGWIGNTTKLVAALISSLAALVSVLSFARSYGIIGRPASHLTVGDLGAKWLGVSPASDTLTSVGDTLHLAATVTDQNGSVLVGASIVWSSVNPKVATVDADGTVISRGAGTTAIVASVGNLLARSQVTVLQRVAAVHVNDDTTVAVPEGERLSVAARAVDARGNVVPGRAATWRLSDTTVATVDSAGAVLGKAQGTATLVATVDGVTAQAPLRVIAVPGSAVLVAGGTQRAAAGAALPQPVVVRVLSTRGRPIAQTAVRFRSADGRSAFDPTTAVTDAEGRARTTWTLGDAPGRQRLLADV